MLECYDMNIISYSDVDHRTGISMDDYGDSSYERDDGDGWCLFSIEVRNTYGLPFEVTFERTGGDYIFACYYIPFVKVVLKIQVRLLRHVS